MSSKNKELFSTEAGKYFTSLALNAELLEKKILKNGTSGEILSFYNKIWELGEEMGISLNDLEKKLEINNE